jgi:hypothetical protein
VYILQSSASVPKGSQRLHCSHAFSVADASLQHSFCALEREIAIQFNGDYGTLTGQRSAA